MHLIKVWCDEDGGKWTWIERWIGYIHGTRGYTVIHRLLLKGYIRILLMLLKILWLICKSVLFTEVLHKDETDNTDDTEKRNKCCKHSSTAATDTVLNKTLQPVTIA